MTMRKRLIAAMSLLVLTLGVVAGYAQRGRASVEIPFSFTAGGSELPAGTYRISTDPNNPGILRIRSEAGDKSALCTVMTRLSPSESAKAQVVFDKVGEKRVLSEVYLPGSDGFQLAGTKGEHTHEKVSGEGN
jgi:hypothetical protein